MSELPKGWKNATIKNLFNLTNGRAFKQTEWSANGLPIIRIQNLNDSTKSMNHYAGNYDKKHYIPTGCVLFAWSGTPGTSFGTHIWNRPPALLNQHIFKIESLPQAPIDKVFSVLAINQELYKLIGLAKGGVGLRHITKKTFEATTLHLPPLPEQKRIVKKLDNCQQQIDSSSEALAKLPQLLADYRASLLASAFRGDLTAKWRAEQKAQGIQHESAQDLLKRLRQERQQQWQKTELQKYEAKGKTPPKGWKQKYEEPASLVLKSSKTDWLTLKIEDICSIIDGDRGKSYPKKHDFSAQGYCLFLNAKNVTSQGLSFIKNQFITKQKDKELRKGRVEKGDLVITTRGTIGNVGYFHKDTPFDIVRINSGMVILRPHSETFNGHFLKYLLRSPMATKQIDNLSSGSAQPQIPIRDFKKCDFSIPSIPEQAEIVRILETAFARIDAIESLHSKLTTEHTQLTQSLLAKAFRGELVPQETD